MYPKNNYEQLVDEKIKNLDLNKKRFLNIVRIQNC